jgi:hypothetical protein
LVCLDQDGTLTLSHEREHTGPLRRMAIIAHTKCRRSLTSPHKAAHGG